jgi:hypothetical protein
MRVRALAPYKAEGVPQVSPLGTGVAAK